ncbi:D-tyrosyl-tRNA(Tyr) deacylase [Nakamurella antarctica]|uniref:D-tyrosyl-tRNA(Tyr) deacylase n=1 Tax=Nakamurella antarctica TaxID=1902245 RepID=A0A3G8ZK92_9ACTN|nr:D-aminoacyl-tRNA deacylase [Nakamurella antarctica]AZI57683.1 D-tyrosyl-tRNA(Tyr) deacylase [Nakamurella antarctica]
MKAVVSRVLQASVSVSGSTVSQITQPGLLALVGVTHTDTTKVAAAMARKLMGLRILRGELSMMELSVPILVVSQFTVYGSTTKGRRPSWGAAAGREVAEPIITALVEELRRNDCQVMTGVFGADMQVSSINDGPFTVLLEL